MTCNQLGGACNQEFVANTFEEIADMSKKHGTEMFQKGDKAHLEAMSAMSAMRELMQTPNAMQEWFDDKRKAFEAAPNFE
jgi:hypothetical protein